MASQHKYIAAIIFTVAVFPALCFGSNPKPGRYGTVSDAISGQPIVGAVVTIKKNITIPRPAEAGSAELFSSTQLTDSKGEYQLPWWVRPIPLGQDGKTFGVPLEDDTSISIRKEGYVYAPGNFNFVGNIDAKLIRIFLEDTCVVASAHSSDFDCDAYKPASLTSIAERQKYRVSDYLIETDNNKYAVIGIHEGGSRNIDAATKELIHRWTIKQRLPKEYESLFVHEVEIEAGGNNYWLPIQNPMIMQFIKEVMHGSVKLYITLIGGTKDRTVFIINEFQGQYTRPSKPAIRRDTTSGNSLTPR